MDNKTKVKVAVVIGIVVLAVIFIFMVVFVKGNRTSVNKNIPKKSSNSNIDNSVNSKNENKDSKEKISLENVVSLGIQDGNLVKINSDLTSDIVKKLGNNYTEFCYGDSKVYIVFTTNDSSSILEIDLLKDDYSENTIFVSMDSIHNIKYYEGKLYYISGKSQLVEYSISEEFTRNITKENEVSNYAIDSKNNCMYVSYKPDGQNAGIYVYDFTENNFTKIININDFAGELLFQDDSLVIDVKEFNKLYMYNTKLNSIVEIGDDNILERAINHIAFYDNVLLYTNGKNIDIRDFSGNNYKAGWYTINDKSITDISMLDSSRLLVSTYDETENVNSSLVIDLLNGTMTEMTGLIYSEVVKIK